MQLQLLKATQLHSATKQTKFNSIWHFQRKQFSKETFAIEATLSIALKMHFLSNDVQITYSAFWCHHIYQDWQPKSWDSRNGTGQGWREMALNNRQTAAVKERFANQIFKIWILFPPDNWPGNWFGEVECDWRMVCVCQILIEYTENWHIINSQSGHNFGKWCYSNAMKSF